MESFGTLENNSSLTVSILSVKPSAIAGDFLRYFVLHEGKQLFFATANVKLASLFKKKFFFLNDEFKDWEFKRTALS